MRKLPAHVSHISTIYLLQDYIRVSDAFKLLRRMFTFIFEGPTS